VNKRILILGGGFARSYAALYLERRLARALVQLPTVRPATMSEGKGR
jgi:hypothetical protein